MTGAFLIFLFYLLLVIVGDKKEKNTPSSNIPLPPYAIDKGDIVCHGISGNVSTEEVTIILAKHCSYFVQLPQELKTVFLERIHHFMQNKTFIIKSNEGFKEMPVLVSAAAIQLTFGLKDYLLPFYKYIRIYPKEYIGDEFFKVLAGNVQNNIITIAWNQLLKGNEDLTDGSNVALHEMSHALYAQKMIIDDDTSAGFCKDYNRLLTSCKEAYQMELSGRKDLYSSYADTDLQEFWAETVEIFFEKPGELHLQHPSVYEAMKTLLNQDPLNKVFLVTHKKQSLSRRLMQIFGHSRT